MKQKIRNLMLRLALMLAIVALALPSLSFGSCETEEFIIHNQYLGACGHTQTTSFTLDKDTNITKIRIWFDTSIAGNTIFAMLYGPDGYKNSFIQTTNSPCQGSWCEAMWSINDVLKAGTYELMADSSSICSNPSGQTTLILYGCETKADDIPDAPPDNSTEGINPPDGVSVVDATSNPASAPVYMGNIVKSGGVATLSGNMELSVNFPAYNKPVDI
ncbi:MAG: hypothetical protein HQK63_12280, partial [Desulfamplus sp.]|nr:hypothetical protein [Desulfamplus sp.]